MAEVTILCPRTGERVPTGLDIDEEAFQSLRPVVSRMKCPACGSEHVWSKANARLAQSSLTSTRHRPPPPVEVPPILAASAPVSEALSNAARRAISLGSKFGLL